MSWLSTTPTETVRRARRTPPAALAALAALLAAPLAAGSLVIDGGTVHPVSGEPFVGRVVVTDGLIAAAGPDAAAPDGAVVIDAAGLHVWPGLFDSLSTVGLIEVDAVAATDDQAEMGAYNPHLKAATAIHPASDLIPVARANGITHAVVAPQVAGGGFFSGDTETGVIAGQAALVHLDGWTVEEMAVDSSIGMVIYWPEIETRSFDFSTFSFKDKPFTEAKEKAEKKIDALRDWFDAARHYAQAEAAGSRRLAPDLKLAALARVLDGGQRVIVQVEAKRDIEAAIAFAGEQGLDLVLAGGREAWKVKETLAEQEIPVLMRSTQSLPDQDDDPYDRPFRTPGELVAAGVKIAFASGAGGGFGPGGPHSSRLIPYEAAQAVPFGLSEEDALRAVTLWPAEIHGVGDRLGSIEPGKIANLIVTDGSPLAITTRVRHLIIAGREVSTDNRHRRLYETYRAR